jgi:hypothetical protein
MTRNVRDVGNDLLIGEFHRVNEVARPRSR